MCLLPCQISISGFNIGQIHLVHLAEAGEISDNGTNQGEGFSDWRPLGLPRGPVKMDWNWAFKLAPVFWKHNMSLSIRGSDFVWNQALMIWSQLRWARICVCQDWALGLALKCHLCRSTTRTGMCSGECIGQDWINRLMCLWLNAAPTKGEMEEFISGTNTVPRLQWNLNLSVSAGVNVLGLA